MVELFTKEKANLYTNSREGENKVGNLLAIPSESLHETLAQYTGKYVILGVPEDIGPRANLGNAGARHSWELFLKAFLNIQVNEYVPINDILIIGHLSVDDLLTTSDQLNANNVEELKRLRELVTIIDERLTKVIKTIISAGKFPIVIGGGHNNAYGLIAGCCEGLKSDDDEIKKQIGVVNIDPHADFRSLEGRHSGNAFSYAFENELLKKYHVIGLHENYNSNFIFDKFNKHSQQLSFVRFEQCIENQLAPELLANEGAEKMGGSYFGLEVDMDGIANFPSSAETPSGWTVNEMRRFVRAFANHKNLIYLHLTEAANKNAEKDLKLIGKSLSYLVTDLIKKNLG